MKIILPVVFVLFFTFQSFAQMAISNTKWKGTAEVPQTVNITLDFRVDSFYIFGNRGLDPETMVYSQHHDSLYFIKISGRSQCPAKTEAWYRIEWLKNGEKFVLHAISDSCAGRANGFPKIRILEKVRQ